MFPGVRSSLVFSGFGFKPPASGFQSYFYSSLKTSPLYSTIDKTSRLKMKSFSTLRDIQRSSQSYTEKRRGRKETEVARRIKGEIKRRETDPASNQFPKCSPPSATQISQSWVEKRRGREEIEATWWRKGEFKGGESNPASNLTPK